MSQEVQKLEAAMALIADHIAELRAKPAAGSRSAYEIAIGEIGTREITGAEHNPRVLEYLRSTTLGRWGASRDETPWCSAFVNWCIVGAGIEGTGSAMARSWLGWGEELATPTEGCVVILSRGKPPQAHVGFYAGKTASGRLRVLGGNQNNGVNRSSYLASRVLGFRAPPTVGR